MKKVLASLFLSIAVLSGCSQENAQTTHELGSFVDVLKENGVDGTMTVRSNANEDIDYIGTYVISAYASTRILSFFKCRDEETAEYNLREVIKNPKMTGQARNGAMIMAATFYPPDKEAVSKIKELFLGHPFN